MLTEKFWDERYVVGDTGWDLGEVSPPLKHYIDQLENKDLSILIPGCGNAYEVDYLLENGFKNITIVDISPTLVETLQQRYGQQAKVVCADFFQHEGCYDLIFEQTFFCAIDPSWRKQYVTKMVQLLATNGKLVGLLFRTPFEKAGPPFGGHIDEYISLFQPSFDLKVMETCYNSFHKRADNEIFIILQKHSNQ